ncbi:MAG: hypothetical protein R3F37_13700 [Candidatus Competibacteraceae bacterium]
MRLAYCPDGYFLVDLDNDLTWNPMQDAMYGPFGAPQDWPVIGDWSGDGSDDIGTYRPTAGSAVYRSGRQIGPE